MTFFALILAMAIGIGVGLIMGLTGAGGGMLAVPALVYSQGWSMRKRCQWRCWPLVWGL